MTTNLRLTKMGNEWFKIYFGLEYVIGDNTKAFGFNSLNERTQHDVNQILEFAQINSGDKILDIPCGYGRHAIELARRDEYRIYGVDINPFLLNVAEYRKEHCLDVEENPISLKTEPIFLKGDMRKFSDRFNNFDLVYNWFWSFGYFSHKENIKTINEFYLSLKTNGKLLIHTIPQENLSGYLEDNQREIFPSKVMGQKYPKGILHFRKSYDPQKKILHISKSIELDNGKRQEKLVEGSVLIYSIKEYIDMLKEIGFKRVRIHDSYFPFKVFEGKK